MKVILAAAAERGNALASNPFFFAFIIAFLASFSWLSLTSASTYLAQNFSIDGFTSRTRNRWQNHCFALGSHVHLAGLFSRGPLHSVSHRRFNSSPDSFHLLPLIHSAIRFQFLFTSYSKHRTLPPSLDTSHFSFTHFCVYLCIRSTGGGVSLHGGNPFSLPTRSQYPSLLLIITSSRRTLCRWINAHTPAAPSMTSSLLVGGNFGCVVVSVVWVNPLDPLDQLIRCLSKNWSHCYEREPK